MNLQENIDRIKEVMGVLNEQTKTSSGCKYSNWQNGDGKTRPKITIAKSDQTGVKVVYEGPESGFCIARAVISDKDTIHQLANIANDITSSKLKELYNSGIYVKPNLSEIKMTKKDNYHDIDIPFIPTTEDKAITNFARRGSWGNPYDAKAQFDIKLNEIYGDEKFGLIEKTDNPIIATGGKSSDIIEYFLAFRDLKTYPIKSKQNPQPITPNPVIPNPQPAKTGGATSTTTQTTSAINDELNNLITSGITDTGVVAPFKENPYIGTGDTTYNQRKQSSYPINPKLRRPWGDPYIYYSATTGDIYYSLCGKRRDQPKKPVIPCPKLTSDNWIKSDSTNRTNAIKTNIFK